jgi:hypothetical protein
MKVSEHSDLSVYYRYVNLREEHLKVVFDQKIPTQCTYKVDKAGGDR